MPNDESSGYLHDYVGERGEDLNIEIITPDGPLMFKLEEKHMIEILRRRGYMVSEVGTVQL